MKKSIRPFALIISCVLAVIGAFLLWIVGNWAINHIGNSYNGCEPEISIPRSALSNKCTFTTKANVYRCPINREDRVCVKVKN